MMKDPLKKEDSLPPFGCAFPIILVFLTTLVGTIFGGF